MRFQVLEARYLLACDLEVDLGDAPPPYFTTTPRDGAAHCAVGPTLGPTRDAEPDGQPSPLADGDGDDEDGVRFGEIRVGQVDAEAIVTVENFDAELGARLDAWIDFNGDGSWGGPWEQIADNLSLGEGETTLEFDKGGTIAGRSPSPRAN